MEAVQTFRAVLERGDRALGWTVAPLPFVPHALWPQMVRLRVRGEIHGPAGTVAFRTSLFPQAGAGGDRSFLLVNRTMQRGSGAQLGMTAEFWLGPDLDERPAELPEPLDAMLDEAEGLRAWYDALSEYTRREMGKWIEGVQGEEARLRRAQQLAERLLSAMEAETELPPVIEQAFRRRPRARGGWLALTVAQRRAELLAVFFYQTPEAREKRAAKLVEVAEKRAQKQAPGVSPARHQGGDGGPAGQAG